MQKRSRIASLLDVQPESHPIQGEQVEVTLLKGGKTEVVLLECGSPDVDLDAWIKMHPDLVTEGLRIQGAVLFRNFNLGSPVDFAKAFSSLNGKPLPYIQRTSPRTEIDAESRIYTASNYPKEQVINMHNESSYAKEWPMRIGFYCVTAPGKGGETPIADVRKIYQLLSKETLRRFEENGILYVRNIHPRLGLSWQEVYQTEEKSKVEDFCVKNGYEFKWGSEDLLTLKWRKKAIERHPETGELLWFNHAFFYNYLTTPGQLYSSLPLEDIPFQCYYGNGKPIEQKVILEIWSKFEEVKMTNSWQKNDFLLLDNMLVAHGRMPFKGDRKILVSMAQAYQSDDDRLNDPVMDIKGQGLVDILNKRFYEKIRYPYAPVQFERNLDADFYNRMISQDLGHFDELVLPKKNGKIWVAGCGSNQALITALKFPSFQVVGSDLSEESLKLCREHKSQLKVDNLELRLESINDISYEEEFDYVISTGVIHHNAQPAKCLNKLSRALKKDGILELMVYNYYHRIFTSAFQKAVRGILGRKYDFETELTMAKDLVKHFSEETYMTKFLSKYKNITEEEFADALIQPVEKSFTVSSLNEIVNQSELIILQPVIDQFSKEQNNYDWNLNLPGSKFQKAYGLLDDIQRWEITNHMLAENSPLLWFYCQRPDCSRPRRSEKEISKIFLKTMFEPIKNKSIVHFRDSSGKYGEGYRERFGRAEPLGSIEKQIYRLTSKGKVMGSAMASLKIETSFSTINPIRLNLATSGFPLLKSC